MTFSKSQGGFVALIIIAFCIIVAIALSRLPADVLNFLWYSLIAIMFLIVIAYLVYRSSRGRRKQNRTSRSAGTGSSDGRDEPRIGQTYRYDEEDE